jgi:hypothetical protein
VNFIPSSLTFRYILDLSSRSVPFSSNTLICYPNVFHYPLSIPNTPHIFEQTFLQFATFLQNLYYELVHIVVTVLLFPVNVLSDHIIFSFSVSWRCVPGLELCKKNSTYPSISVLWDNELHVQYASAEKLRCKRWIRIQDTKYYPYDYNKVQNRKQKLSSQFCICHGYL